MGRVLIVDACPDMRDIMAEIVGEWSHEVETVPDALEALEKVATFRPHVVMTSVDLPGMDGPTLAHTIRARGDTDTFIICHTGYADDETHRRALAAGCDRIVTKPASLDVLERVVTEAFTRAATKASS